jgi:hypothetical protein
MKPSEISKEIPWKLEGKSGSIERYVKNVDSEKGRQTIRLEVDSDGKPVKFSVTPGPTFLTKSFEIVDEIPLEQFHVEPKDGFVSHRIYQDTMRLQTGAKFSWSQFKASDDTTSFKLDGSTLFALVDPSEASSMNASAWLRSPNAKYKKVVISKGTTKTGFYDPIGDEIQKMTTSTPTFVLVNKDSVIIGLWLGFDPENPKAFEADIVKALG